jgi:charged multivesicular body protein 4
MKSAHKNMNVDDVHNLMDDVAEQQEIANEISEAISNPVGFQQDVDEDDLLKELEELEQQDLEEKLLDVDQLPSVPAASLPAKDKPAAAKVSSKADDDEMKELEAWAS